MEYYNVDGNDNDSEFYYTNHSILKYCPKCGLITNREEAIQLSIKDFKIKIKKFNLSACYDGPLIASETFFALYKENNLKGLDFIDLPKSKGFYLIKYLKELRFDYENAPDIYFKNKCPVCKQWYEIAKVYPIKIIDKDENKMKEDTFYRTDLEYGEKVMRTPLLIATEKIQQYFKKARIKDVYFEVAG